MRAVTGRPQLGQVADRLTRAADWLDHLTKGATPKQWAVKAEHGRDITDEGWSSLFVVGPGDEVLADLTATDDDAAWVAAEARAQFIAALDPDAVAALVPVLRDMAKRLAIEERLRLSAADAGMPWSLNPHLRDLTDSLGTFAARVLREEETGG